MLFFASLAGIMLAAVVLSFVGQPIFPVAGFISFFIAWFLLLYGWVGFEPLASASGVGVLLAASVLTSWLSVRFTKKLSKTNIPS